ncbi:hypothetical protein DFH29DRAFT_825199 [Suillus ampliporus]|nr:hypothetical protein DFH29DRAFT_825199 [Suillus ampliporus]
MSLLKIPFLVASAIGVHISFTSSTPPPSSEEKVVPSMSTCMRWFLRLQAVDMKKISAWALSSAEVANILAMHIDPSNGIYNARAVHLLRSLHPTPITPSFLAGSLAITIGGALRLYCMLTLGKFWSFPLNVRKERKLVTRWPYSVVRHPSYTGYLLQYVGVIVMYGNQGSWLRQSGVLQVPFVRVLAALGFFTFTVGTCLAINRSPVEDKMLQRALGEDWENWAKRVKYRLLPGVY